MPDGWSGDFLTVLQNASDGSPLNHGLTAKHPNLTKYLGALSGWVSDSAFSNYFIFWAWGFAAALVVGLIAIITQAGIFGASAALVLLLSAPLIRNHIVAGGYAEIWVSFFTLLLLLSAARCLSSWRPLWVLSTAVSLMLLLLSKNSGVLFGAAISVALLLAKTCPRAAWASMPRFLLFALFILILPAFLTRQVIEFVQLTGSDFAAEELNFRLTVHSAYLQFSLGELNYYTRHTPIQEGLYFFIQSLFVANSFGLLPMLYLCALAHSLSRFCGAFYESLIGRASAIFPLICIGLLLAISTNFYPINEYFSRANDTSGSRLLIVVVVVMLVPVLAMLSSRKDFLRQQA